MEDEWIKMGIAGNWSEGISPEDEWIKKRIMR